MSSYNDATDSSVHLLHPSVSQGQKLPPLCQAFLLPACSYPAHHLQVPEDGLSKAVSYGDCHLLFPHPDGFYK